MSDTKPITLGIEMSNPSSTASGAEPSHSVALWNNDQLLGSAPLPDGARGSDGVLSAIATLANSCDVSPSTIGHILVSVGPGGYTALRIATTSAKILAESLGAQLIAVPTPRVAAVRIDDSNHPAIVALASKKDRTHATLKKDDVDLQELGVTDADALRESGVRSIPPDQHPPKSIIEYATANDIAVRSIVLDARDLLAASEGLEPIDPLHLSPEYAREPDAVTQWRARSSG